MAEKKEVIKYPLWTPDCNSTKTYEHLNKNSDAFQWAWEFLRRNLDYQADYKRACMEKEKRKSKSPNESQKMGCYRIFGTTKSTEQ